MNENPVIFSSHRKWSACRVGVPKRNRSVPLPAVGCCNQLVIHRVIHKFTGPVDDTPEPVNLGPYSVENLWKVSSDEPSTDSDIGPLTCEDTPERVGSLSTGLSGSPSSMFPVWQGQGGGLGAHRAAQGDYGHVPQT